MAMKKPVPVSIRIDNETAGVLAEIAKSAGTTPDTVAAVMLALFVRRELPPKKPPVKRRPIP
jgi:predicted transcriptional regulator